MKLVAKVGAICLASMLMMGMALVGNASAALLWLVCLKGSGLTKFTNSKCLEAGSGGEWQSLGVRAGTTITVKLLAISILLRDTKTKAAVNCFNTGSKGEGVIEEGGKGKVRVAEYEKPGTNCVSVEGCEKGSITAVKGVHLPWNTEVVVGTNGKPLTKLSNSGAGEPGWEVKCTIAGIKQTDICTSEAEEVELINEVTKNPEGVSELLVRSRFQQAAEGTCSLGGAKAGRVLGLLAILLPGGALSVNT